MKKYAVLALVLISLTVSCLFAFQPAKASGDFWVTRASIPVAMDVSGIAAVNGQIYAFGLNADGKAVTFAYDPISNTWASKAPMPTSRSDACIVAYQNEIYVIGGITGFDSRTGIVVTGANELYDPATDTWAIRTSMPTPRTSIQANLENDKIYLISGLVNSYTGPVLTNATEIYDPSSDIWSTAAPIPTSVFSYSSVAVDKKIYVIGGESFRVH